MNDEKKDEFGKKFGALMEEYEMHAAVLAYREPDGGAGVKFGLFGCPRCVTVLVAELATGSEENWAKLANAAYNRLSPDDQEEIDGTAAALDEAPAEEPPLVN